MNKQALIDLRDKVKAGERPDDTRAIGNIDYDSQVYFWHAFDGSLDAAEALHEALLPGWGWGRQPSIDEIYVFNALGDSALARRTKYGGIDDSPARSWLIAILEALIAEAE